MHEHRLRFYSQTDAVERGFLAPFQGASLVGGWFRVETPGCVLEPLRGTESNVQTAGPSGRIQRRQLRSCGSSPNLVFGFNPYSENKSRIVIAARRYGAQV
jgi:hypothetical protein